MASYLLRRPFLKSRNFLRHFSKPTENFRSTRGHAPSDADFFNVLRTGLAPDGGLFVAPEFTPFGPDQLGELLDLPYQKRIEKVIRSFPTAGLSDDVLQPMLQKAYAPFHHKDVLPVSHLEGHHYLLEAFHGPTASFKDLSLQLTSKLVRQAMDNTGKRSLLGVLVATSGDTGTAALDGFANQPDTFVVVLYPLKGVSAVQQAQMLTAEGNVCVLGIDADFDWCQNAVKNIFNDSALQERLHKAVPHLTLTSANSINWGRFLPQIAFNVSGYCDLVNMGAVELGAPIDVCVPTGNFGNILGALYARRLGVPIERLICASNDNNVLTDFIRTGEYDVRSREFHLTISPAIDILVSSNLERFLHLLSDGDSATIARLFGDLKTHGHFKVEGELLERVQTEVEGTWCSGSECTATIKEVFDRTRTLIDPHTAVAKFAADNLSPVSSDSSANPMLISSTAHFSKFPHAMLQALDIPEPSLGDLEPPSTDNTDAEHAAAYYTNVVQSIPSLLQPLRDLNPRNTFHADVDQLAEKPVLHTSALPADHDVLVQALESFVSKAAQQ